MDRSRTPIILELRVHGVRGTPPAAVLGTDPDAVEQVAGNSITGIFRATNSSDDDESTHPVEAYSWGALTSGTRAVLGWVQRALWLVLLPFALVNLACWARESAGLSTTRARAGLRAVRASGLLLTMLAVLTPCVVAMDMVAWQCFRGHTLACATLPGWLTPVAAWGEGPRIAVASLVPLVVVGLVFLASYTSLSRYEVVTDESLHAARIALASRPERTGSVLDHPLMWQGEVRARRLQYLHLSTALAVIVGYSGFHLVRVAPTPWLWITTVSAGLVVAVAMLSLMHVTRVDLEHDDSTLAVTEEGLPERLDPRSELRAGQVLFGWAALTLVAHLVVLVSRVPAVAASDIDRDWYGANLWVIAILTALLVVNVVVFLVSLTRGVVLAGSLVLFLSGLGAVAWLVRTRAEQPWSAALAAALLAFALLCLYFACSAQSDRRQLAWTGAGPAVFGGAAIVVALVFTSGAVVGAANWLNGPHQSVADIVVPSGEPVTDVSTATTSGQPWTVTGPVVVSDARIQRSRKGTIVTSGVVRVQTISMADVDRRTRDVPSGFVRAQTLLLPADTASITLDASCVGRADNGESCTASSRGFRDGGTVPVSTTCDDRGAQVPCLQIAAASGAVLVSSAAAPQTAVVVPQVLSWVPLWVLTVVLALVVVTVVLAARFWIGRGAARQVRGWVSQDPIGVPNDARRIVGDARVRAALAHRPEPLLDWVGALTVLVAFPALAASATGVPPWEAISWFGLVATGSLYLVLALSAGLVMVAAQLRRSVTARRNVGILWDITTFWPRTAHPFGPPCYAERVVPEIVRRIRWALEQGPSRGVVVLSGHSQGSLITAAVMCRLYGQESRLRLVTYGSQIRAIYGRVFPAAAGPLALGHEPTPGALTMRRAWPDIAPGEPEVSVEVVTGLRGRFASVDHWVNLFRRSDPLGYRVFGDHDSSHDRVVLEVPKAASGDPCPEVQTHGDYQATPEYARVIEEWAAETPRGT